MGLKSDIKKTIRNVLLRELRGKIPDEAISTIVDALVDEILDIVQ